MVEIQKDSYEEIIEENEKYLKMFEEFLEKRNYRKSAIDEHISRVDFYINHYLMWGIPKHMEDGCSTEVYGFITINVNEKVFPPSVHNIDFFLASVRLFYECMRDNRLVSKEQFKDFEEDIDSLRDEMVEDYYEKNPKKIELYDVVTAMEIGHDSDSAYMNIKSGEVEYVPDFADFDEDEKYYKLDRPDWVKLPEYRDYDIMTKFAYSLDDMQKSEKLVNILHNKKAYRNFKDAIHEMDIEDEYYEFYSQYVDKLAKEWLDENVDDLDDFNPDGELLS